MALALALKVVALALRVVALALQNRGFGFEGSGFGFVGRGLGFGFGVSGFGCVTALLWSGERKGDLVWCLARVLLYFLLFANVLRLRDLAYY